MARSLLIAVAAALMLAASSSAATIDDLRALGYQVSPSASNGACTTYYVSGYGIGVYASSCDADFQATLDSIGNPAAHCNRVWQYAHSDQFSAFQAIVGKGYAVSGDQCADVYTVTNPDGSKVYSGSGAGLPGLNATLGPPAPSTTPATPGGSSAAPATCLPLCPTTTTDPVATGGTTTTAAPTLEQLVAATQLLAPGGRQAGLARSYA